MPLVAYVASVPGGEAPVVATMAARLGIPYAAAAQQLSFRDGVFRWKGTVIDGARYDKVSQTTVAPARALARLTP